MIGMNKSSCFGIIVVDGGVVWQRNDKTSEMRRWSRAINFVAENL